MSHCKKNWHLLIPFFETYIKIDPNCLLKLGGSQINNYIYKPFALIMKR